MLIRSIGIARKVAVGRQSITKNGPPRKVWKQLHEAKYTHSTIVTGSASNVDSKSTPVAPEGFTGLERIIADSFGGPEGDWREVESCWVLYPPAGKDPTCLFHFIGGAFVGAAPQLSYAPLLHALASRGAIIVATPFATTFDHCAAADGIHSRVQRCIKSLGPQAVTLPSFGLGHSLGALLHLLICSRYIVPRAGNALLSFNNRPATDSIPVLSPFIAPSARALGPILSQLATSPLRSGVEQWIDLFRSLAPAQVKQALPVLEQLAPIFLDVAQGTEEFSPAPEQTRSTIRSGYTVPRNLLIRFADDTIDETPQLASVLQSSAAAGQLELTVRTMNGDHVRPMQQDFSTRLPPEVATFASAAVTQGESFWGQIGQFAAQSTSLSPEAKESLSGLAKVAGGLTAAVGRSLTPEDVTEDIEELADELAAWTGIMEVRNKPKGPMALPAAQSSSTS